MRPLLLAFVLAVPSLALAAPELPKSVVLPKTFVVYEGTAARKSFDEATFFDGKHEVKKRGATFVMYLQREPEGFHEPADAAIKKWEPLLKANGWVLRGRTSDAWTFVRAGPPEAWLWLDLGEFGSPRLVYLEVGATPVKLVATPPAAKPETVRDDGDFPWIPRIPGATFDSTGRRDEPLDVTSGADKEPHLVGRGYVIKWYQPPATLSKLEFELAASDALAKAGWTVLPLPAGQAEGEGVVRAHYAKNGRDLWAVLGRAADDSNTGLAFSTVDLGAEDWVSALKGECRLPLYGVTFDFDKATLRPDSESVLQKALAALQGAGSLAVEVQGHTDDVGDEAYNLKLSDARAASVRTWFTQHGIAAGRLTSRGYGENQPVADNGSDAGRAKNRRVELVCAKGR